MVGSDGPSLGSESAMREKMVSMFRRASVCAGALGSKMFVEAWLVCAMFGSLGP